MRHKGSSTRRDEMTKNEATAAALLKLIAAHNGDVKAALNSLGGEGFYEKFAGDIYDALRAK
jgi:hypothetical protein